MSKSPKEISEKKILIVEDDDTLRITLRRTLELEGYQVMEASGGRIAQNLLGMETFDIVITDIRMPDINGIELMHFIKRSLGLPVILITGFAEAGQREELISLGADGYIAKPFKKDLLLAFLRRLFGYLPSEEDTEENQDSQYCKVEIDDFISGREIKYDIFVRLSSLKYLKIANHGSDLSAERLASFRAKNIKFLYMKKEDFAKYIEFNMILAPAVRHTSILAKTKKMAFLKTTGELLLEDLYINGVNEESFDRARAITESTVSLLTEQEDMMRVLELLGDHTDFLYAHSLGVSLYGAMISRAMRWTAPVTIYKASMGGLLHDIGKKEIDREVLNKPRKDLTVDEIKMLESHPLRGMEILRQIHGIPQDIIQIVMQHHENCLGAGYPVGLRKNNIHPLARIIAIANEFCNHAIKNPSSPNGMHPHEAITKLMTLLAEHFDHAMLLALMELFAFTPPPEFLKGRHRTKYTDETPSADTSQKKRAAPPHK